MTGSGTELDPYIIEDIDDLQKIGDHIHCTRRFSRPWDDSFGEAAQFGTWTVYPSDGVFWNKVDDWSSDADDTYIQAQSHGAYCLLAFEGTPLSLPDGATNIQVIINARVRNTASGTSYIQGMVRYASTDYLIGSDTPISSIDYSLKSWFMNNPPWNPTLPWSTADVYALVTGVGVKVSDASPNVRITQMYIEVRYDLAASYYYELANDINASVTSIWNWDGEKYRGFRPIGTNSVYQDWFPNADVSSYGTWTGFPVNDGILYDKLNTKVGYRDNGIRCTANAGAMFSMENIFDFPPAMSRSSVSVDVWCGTGTYSNPIKIRHILRVVGTDYYGEWQDVQHGTGRSRTWTTNPATGLPWTASGFESISSCGFEIKYLSGDRTVTVNWVAIQTWYYGFFEGYFDGNGHKISGLYINRDVSNITYYGGNVGLFGSTWSSTIKNVVLEGVDITGRRVGALVGECGGGWGDPLGYVQNCIVSGSVKGSRNMGGLLGACYGVEVSNCRSSCSVEGYGVYSTMTTGGFIGSLGGDTLEGLIEDCYATGDVVGGRASAGGFIGELWSEEGTLVLVRRCYASGNVYSNNAATYWTSVGGFVGTIGREGRPIMQCFASGNVSNLVTGGARGAYGGFVGYIQYVGAQISDCYALGNVSAHNTIDNRYVSGGGFAGYSWVYGAIEKQVYVHKVYSKGMVSVSGVNSEGGAFWGAIDFWESEPIDFENCFADLETAGLSDLFGIIYGGFDPPTGVTGKTTAEMNDIQTFLNAGWDIEEVNPTENEYYPFLRWQL